MVKEIVRDSVKFCVITIFKENHMKLSKLLTVLYASFSSIVLLGCSTKIPKGIEPVTDFQADKYLGKWYEIARIDNRFEKNMINVTADYSLRDDGGIKVVNRGFDTSSQKWAESVGKAFFVKSPDIGALKVSFFGPFYGGYNIVKLDKDYQTVLIAGSNKEYLWILSRNACISDETKQAYVKKAAEIGYDTALLNFEIQKEANCQ